MVVAIGVFAIGEVLGSSIEAGERRKMLPVPQGHPQPAAERGRS